MIRHNEASGVTIFALERMYDSLSTAANLEFHRQLAKLAALADPPLIVLDMTRTEMFGSTFLEVVVRSWKTLSHRGGKLALASMKQLCAEVLRQTNLDELWGIYATVPEAIAALKNK